MEETKGKLSPGYAAINFFVINCMSKWAEIFLNFHRLLLLLLLFNTQPASTWPAIKRDDDSTVLLLVLLLELLCLLLIFPLSFLVICLPSTAAAGETESRGGL